MGVHWLSLSIEGVPLLTVRYNDVPLLIIFLRLALEYPSVSAVVHQHIADVERDDGRDKMLLVEQFPLACAVWGESDAILQAHLAQSVLAVFLDVQFNPALSVRHISDF